jgi:hypothetical protein
MLSWSFGNCIHIEMVFALLKIIIQTNTFQMFLKGQFR